MASAPQTETGNARRLEIDSDLSELGKLTAFTQSVGEAQELSADQQFALDLCLEEAVVNIITHGMAERADGHICLTLVSDAPALMLCLEDDGIAFDPTGYVVPGVAESLESAPIGGAGIPLIRKLAAGMRYERKDGRNQLFLSFGPPNPAAASRFA